VRIIHDMINKGITKEELEIAKGSFKGNSIIRLQDIVTQTKYNGEYVLMGDVEKGKIVSYKDIYEKYIHGISLEDIHRIIKLYFTSKNMCICTLSEKLPSLEIIQKEFETIV